LKRSAFSFERTHDAGVVLLALEEDVHLIAGGHRDGAVCAAELLERDLTLGLVADVDDREVLADRDHRATEDLALLGILLRDALGEQRGEVVVLKRGSVNHDEKWLLRRIYAGLSRRRGEGVLAAPPKVNAWLPAPRRF
jgi:hypothetical protein